MIHIQANNVNDALPEACYQHLQKAEVRDSRNGKASVYRGPFCTTYTDPTRRVLLDADRDANPFFHLVEALWMLAGRNDVASLDPFNAGMKQYSDNGRTFHAAYGHRWRQHFQFDQVQWIIKRLKENPDDRRAVLGMWDPLQDSTMVDEGGKDVPCNISASFQVTDGKLDLYVFNRSNDLIWGTYGANVVHFSILQEFVALACGYEVGHYHQVSANTHVYEKHWPLRNTLAFKAPDYARRPESASQIVPLLQETGLIHNFLVDCHSLFHDVRAARGYMTTFFTEVVSPMVRAFFIHRDNKATAEAIDMLPGEIDWLVAGREWLQRRLK